jgi:redox-sensitive bicupin YhaK (pirin superfamily)
VPITPERAKLDTTHPHRGFDNLWYILSGDASTGHSTGPEGRSSGPGWGPAAS